ncbi:MAG: hypothetical protein LBV79_10830, partial [Candidatus Adiutrix sp.]|nr:hypothetical protein [Candidatus Adiutrix sp.]
MRWLAVVLILIMLGAAGCSSEDSGREAAPSAGSLSPEERAAIEKWNSYVDLGNSIDTSFYGVMDAYFQAFGNGPDYKAGGPEAAARFTAAL